MLWPGSHCPRCGTPLAWFENVPVLAWLALRGRCRHCHQPIAARYPLVESLCAGLWVAMLLAKPDLMGAGAPPLLLLLAGWLLASWLLPMVLIDLDRLWLPEPMLRWGWCSAWPSPPCWAFSKIRPAAASSCFNICWPRPWDCWASRP